MGSLEVIISNLLHVTHIYDWNTAHRPLWWDCCPPGWPPLSSGTWHFYTTSHFPNVLPSPLCLPSIMLHPVPWMPAFLVLQGFTPPNTANFSFESLLEAIPKYHQQIHEHFLLCSLCALLYLLQSNDDSMLYICMALDLVWEAMAVASLQGLCLAPCQEHRRHWHISAECINPRLFSSLLMENPLASNCLLGTKITSA